MTDKAIKLPASPPLPAPAGSGANAARLRVALNDIELIATPGRTPPYMQGKGMGAKLDEICRIAHQALALKNAQARQKTTGAPLLEGRWDIDESTGEAREWRIIAKDDIDGVEWTFPKGKRLRGFKDHRDGNWCVYAPGQYMESKIVGVPETLLEIVRPVNRPNH